MGFKRGGEANGGPPYWLISREGAASNGHSSYGYHDVLTIEGKEEELLPLFSSEQSAASFLRAFASSTSQNGWRATEAWAGELLTLLSDDGPEAGPCSGVGAVIFDPEEPAIQNGAQRDSRLGRRCFMDRLLGRGYSWSLSR